MTEKRLNEAATATLEACKTAGKMLATVESCTGGLIAASLTEIAGSSAVVEAGFVTYSNGAKSQLVGVPSSLVQAHGAVSKEVAIAMAEGGLWHCAADIVVSVTGVAGPAGGSDDKPVGTVHMACSVRGGKTRHVLQSYPDTGRSEIRIQTVLDALMLVQTCLSEDVS
ncbi:CinA family protein [Pararhizobium sp. IMCC21322]|uniref:CinA family protein n=1 Tax=Pararhizobium sp. IMCC21322 TaxID=3067903 RepID=UPI002740EB35|nr:nicotinamide-nucleotide amidohydrolase family protein [Pararhizobium sp. IMCC21322]